MFTQTSHDQVQFDENLYHCVGQGKLRFGDQSLDQWKTAGQDVHSSLGDPGFIDPLKGDFRIPASSIMQGIHFDPLVLEGVGPGK